MESIINTKNSANINNQAMPDHVTKNMEAVQALSKHSANSQFNQPQLVATDGMATKNSIHSVQGQNVVSDMATKHISSQHASKSLFNQNVENIAQSQHGSKMSVHSMNNFNALSKNSNAITADQVMLQNGNPTVVESFMSKQLSSNVQPVGSKVF